MMLDPEHFTVVFGRDVVDSLNRRPDCANDTELCARQIEEDRMGYVGVEICPSLYGWSVRHASGLNGFNLLASARYGEVDGTRADALRFAGQWQTQDANRRYVWIRKSDESLDDRWPYGERR